jgi:hypothetical protein
MQRFGLLSLVILLLSANSYTSGYAAAGEFETLLAGVPNTPTTRIQIWYGSQKTLKDSLGLTIRSAADLSKLSVSQQAAFIKAFDGTLYASDFLGIDETDQRAAFGIDSYQVERELTVGRSPAWYNLMEGGVQPVTVAGALTRFGYKSQAAAPGTLYTTPGPNAPAIAATLYKASYLTSSQVFFANSPELLTPLPGVANKTVPVITADPKALVVIQAIEPDGTPLITAHLAEQSGLFYGLSYTRDRNGAQRWIVARGYASQAEATAAANTLPATITNYRSVGKSYEGRQLFRGWTVKASVATLNNQAFAVVAVLTPLANADLGLVPLIKERDLGFLGL